MRYFLTVPLITAFLMTASGCGVKLLYNNADRLTRWWVSDYISMTNAQREFLDGSSAEILYWHRTTQLVIYRERLLTLANAVSQPISETELQEYVDTIEGLGKAINARAVPVALQILLSLSPQQLEDFEAEIAKSNRDYVKEAKRPTADQLDEDARDYSRLLKRFTGRLSREQRGFIDAQHARLQPDAQVLLDYRQVWQQKLLAALRSEPPEVGRLNDLMVNFDRHYTDDFAQMLDANEIVYRELTLGVLNGLTLKQRPHLVKELRNYAELCSELIADAPAMAPTSPATLFVLPTIP